MKSTGAPVRYAIFPSPVGRLFAVFGERGLLRLEFGHHVSEADFRRSLPASARRVEPATDPLARRLAEELERYFERNRPYKKSRAAPKPNRLACLKAVHARASPCSFRPVRFTTRLALAGTPFQRRVWQALRRIPFGGTVSYAELARRVGAPKAARAVGQAVGANPVPILVPCHRVIASTGALGGFSAGLPLKRWLLRHEGAKAKTNHE